MVDQESEKPSEAGQKRSLKRIAVPLVALVVLAGGGYCGWTFLQAPGSEPAHEETADAAEAIDETHVAAVDYAIAAETSFFYSYALSEKLAALCGPIDAPALKAAAEAEAHKDAKLAVLSGEAAERRMHTVTHKSCNLMVSEVLGADGKAAELAAAALPKPAAH